MSLQWLHNSRTTANVKMITEWTSESISNPTIIISMSSEWDLFSSHRRLRPGNAWPVAVISLLQHRRGVQSPLKWWDHLSFCNWVGTTSIRISNHGRKENCSEPSLWHTPSRPQAYVRGRCTTGYRWDVV